ncbi:MAG: hypothetical protein M1839_001065 [Geoglossum umbratile]|nr:MAG: hypothetical protein M1839_001065 [Geoglossum umbratile]
MRLSILFLTILAALTTLTTTQEISRTLPPAGNNTHPGSCGYYLTSHPANRGYFRHHRFYDFRNIVDDASGVAPGEVTQDGGLEEATSGFFWEETWRREWVVQSWGKKTSGKCPVKMQHSSGNVYIEHNDEAAESATTHLTLRTSRQSTFQSTSEIEGTQKNLLYASIRMRARVQGASGAVAGLFTYLDDENEGDIEILTRESEATVK